LAKIIVIAQDEHPSVVNSKVNELKSHISLMEMEGGQHSNRLLAYFTAGQSTMLIPTPTVQFSQPTNNTVATAMGKAVNPTVKIPTD